MNKMITILIAEDEIVLGKLIIEALERRSYQILWGQNGQEAYDLYLAHRPDLCILDVMMSAINGFELATMIRKICPVVPLLFLTARSEIKDVIRGFESGGNDYLKKPFSLEELILRIQELLRRSTLLTEANPVDNTAEIYQLGMYTFNTITQILQSEKETKRLSFKESELLKNLLLHKNHLMQRKDTLLKIWNDDNFFNARTMDVYIARLRKYLRHDPRLSIINIRGYGFKLLEHD